MKLGIIGTKDFKNYKFFSKAISRFKNISLIISGGSSGTDFMAKKYARDNKIEFIEFPPDRNKHGDEAKHVRDRLIAENSDIIIAFWDGKCEGTEYTISYAQKIKKPVTIVNIS